MGIVYIYGQLIQMDLKKFEQVPPRYRDDVYYELVRRGIEHLAILGGNPYQPR